MALFLHYILLIINDYWHQLKSLKFDFLRSIIVLKPTGIFFIQSLKNRNPKTILNRPVNQIM